MQAVELIFVPTLKLELGVYAQKKDSSTFDLKRLQSDEDIELFKNEKDEWKLVEPYLISCDNVKESNDKFLCNAGNKIKIHNDYGAADRCCKKIMATPEQMCLIYSEENITKSSSLLTFYRQPTIDDFKNIMLEDNGICAIDAKEYCPNYNGRHKGKDCSCKSGFAHTAELINNKVIIHLNAI